MLGLNKMKLFTLALIIIAVGLFGFSAVFTVLRVPITRQATTITVVSTANLPNPATVGPYIITVWNESFHPSAGGDKYREYMKVTSISGKVLTVVRGYAGSHATAKFPKDYYYAVVKATSLTPTPTFTMTCTNTATNTCTKTATNTATNTCTATATRTPTMTPTATP